MSIEYVDQLLSIGGSDCCFIEEPDSSQSRRWSVRDVEQAVDIAVEHLSAHGIGTDDRVAVFGENGVEYLAFMFAAMRVGAVTVPINIRQDARTIAAVCAHAGVKLAVVDSPFDDLVPATVPKLRLASLAPMDRTRKMSLAGRSGVALQMYTSGSSGDPKGVLLSHQALLWAINEPRAVEATQHVRTIVAAPLYHMNGLLSALRTIAAGGTVCLLPRFSADRYLLAAARQRATHLVGVPSMFAAMLEQKELLIRLDLDSVAHIALGSASLPDELLDRIGAAFPRAAISNNYGTTEVCAVFGRHPDGFPVPRNSLGAVRPEVSVRLVDGEDADHGRLLVRSPAAMLGYASGSASEADVAPNGWYDTGDVLRRDGQGFFYYIERADDMIVCGGENLYPSVVERLLETHPSVKEAAVVPVSHPIKGAVPVAYVVPADDAEVDEEDLRLFALEHGPAHAHPRRIYHVSDLPLTSLGKIDRRELARRAAAVLDPDLLP